MGRGRGLLASMGVLGGVIEVGIHRARGTKNRSYEDYIHYRYLYYLPQVTCCLLQYLGDQFWGKFRVEFRGKFRVEFRGKFRVERL